MARRYEQITELYRQSIREITSRPENWTSFLCSACRNYRLPFDELVLILSLIHIYMIISLDSNSVAAGSRYELSLEDVQEWVNEMC